MISRRSTLGLIGAAISAPAASPFASEIRPQGPSSRLHLLGTGGGPNLGGDRGMACNAITIGGKTYVIDCGYGAAQALTDNDIALRSIDSIFITHNHADHMLDYGSLLFLTWLQGRNAPLNVYGAPPLKHMTGLHLEANEVPLQYYKNDMAMGPMGQVIVHELTDAGAVLDDGTVRVSCVMVEHPPVIPSFAYRFDLPDRSIVFSGDTANSEGLIALARDADVLVHEATMVTAMLQMMGAAPGGKPDADGVQPQGFDAGKFRDHVLLAHTAAEDAGRIATRAGVRMLVLNHLAPSSYALVADGEWIAAARKHFSGQIVVARDGMVL